MRFSCSWVSCVVLYCVYRKYPNPTTTNPSNTRLNTHDVAWTSSSRLCSSTPSMRARSSDRMRWFIVQTCAEKLQGFPNPNVSDTWADPNPLGVHKYLSKDVVDLPTALVTEAHVEFCVCVAKQIHVFCSCAVCKSGGLPWEPLTISSSYHLPEHLRLGLLRILPSYKTRQTGEQMSTERMPFLGFVPDEQARRLSVSLYRDNPSRGTRQKCRHLRDRRTSQPRKVGRWECVLLQTSCHDSLRPVRKECHRSATCSLFRRVCLFGWSSPQAEDCPPAGSPFHPPQRTECSLSTYAEEVRLWV
jgi:hypothetical protein